MTNKTPSRDGDPGHHYAGTIGRTLKQSTPWWRPHRRAPKGAPNIVVILLDDLGFSDFGCYGSEIRTPNIDALAAGGLKFTNYTTVPMCTPARAALMTGKNPHAVGCGWLTHANPGYPGYQAGEISKDAPTIPELLRANGYSTYAVGKWHNTPDYNVTAGGDRASWPLQRGFDQFYGFLGAETNFFSPAQLVEGNEFARHDAYPEDYYCSNDWTDRALRYVRSHRASSPDRPFFLYLAHNAPHVPLHAPAQDIARYAGAYAQGWEATRQARFVRQKAIGLIPNDWRLSTHSPGVADWEAFTPQEREVLARYMELYAAMVDNIDQNVGRLVAELKHMGIFDDTLIVLTSDNGATSIGGPAGSANVLEKRLSQTEAPDLGRQMLDAGQLGGIESYPAYPVGWGNCSNTPFRFYKRTPMNGGIRVPLIVCHPNGIADPGAMRSQWVHVTDHLPMLLQSIGAPYPEQFNGLRTRQLDGVDYHALLRQPNHAPMRSQQHFELEGNRGYISWPWKIASLQPPGRAIDLDNWLLFNLDDDPTECDDLAAREPAVLARLVHAFERDAAANHVYPLDNRDPRRVLAIPPFVETLFSTERCFYPDGDTITPMTIAPLVSDRDYRLECVFDWQPAQQGVLFAIGDNTRGFAAFVLDGQVTVAFSAGTAVQRHVALPLSPGLSTLILEHSAPGKRRGAGLVSLHGNSAVETLDMSPTFLRLDGEGMDIGLDRRRKVSARYADRGAFAYTGRITHVRIVPGPKAPDSESFRSERLAQLD